MESKHAPAERTSADEIKRKSNRISSLDNLRFLLDALPYVAVILDKNRQIVFSNSRFISMLNVESFDNIISLRPGEAVNCVHSKETYAGCGTAESCRYCGAVNAILETQKTGNPAVHECRIHSDMQGQFVTFDLEVSTSPFILDDEQFIILTLKDISNEKRRKILERIFFHDVLNSAGLVSGFLSILKDEDDPPKIKEYAEIAYNSNERLIEEILAQKQLVAAENNELITEPCSIYSLDMLNQLIIQMKQHNVAEKKDIILSEKSENFKFITDPVILRRVLINLLKNALEATEKHNTVILGCEKKQNENIFFVNNNIALRREIQLQIFKRSFSTKGADRGIGTYSVKLLTEKYLNGKVWFESNQQNGTTFFVSIPA